MNIRQILPTVLSFFLLGCVCAAEPAAHEKLKFPGATGIRIAAGGAGLTVYDASGQPRRAEPGRILRITGDVVYVPAGASREHDIRALRSPYSDLVAHWAPVIFMDTDDSYTEADYITAVDFDGDWNMTNNWENLPKWSSPVLDSLARAGTAYWWVVETRTHWFIGYAVFHPRDWEDADTVKSWLVNRAIDPIKKAKGDGTGEHENDMEGAIFTVRKVDGEEFGRLELIETQAHDNFWQYSPKGTFEELRDGGKKRETIDGEVIFTSSKPSLYQEAKGHGLYGSPKKTNFDGKKGDGLIYRYDRRGAAGEGEADYALIPLSTLWNRYLSQKDRDTDLFVTSLSRTAFAGDTKDDNSANPPWAWQDKDYAKELNDLWFAEPARFVTHRFRPAGGEPFSLEVLRRSCP